MFGPILKKVFGSKNERELKRLSPIVDAINVEEAEIEKLSDEELKDYTSRFRERIKDGEGLDDMLVKAFAVVREASRRYLGMRHFDVQLLGGIVLHEGKISEMKTGEGKTLVATLALYLNALSGKGAHLVTVNDYLARRDAKWMAPIYHNLGLTISIIQHDASFIYDPEFTGKDSSYACLRQCERKEAYGADITYGTNNEFGFDYLRDNMKYSVEDYVQRDLHYAIVDEVDSILIDEARTPLIISGPSEESTDKYYTIDRIAPGLKKELHYTVDEKIRQVMLTEDGVAKVEELLGIENLYDPAHIETLHHVAQALKAHVLFKRDVDYVVKDEEVIIVDEFTGRLMPGRRWSEGLHQAVEAKEKVTIEKENQTLATITFQNYFRMYEKLAGMTGTADTEAAEFKSIYDLDVMVIPTNKPMIRVDESDLVFKTEKEKFKAVVDEIEMWNKEGRPVLVGTISIERSERIASMLKKRNVPHHVLNAKHHEMEAEIVSQAGRLGAVTIATNMAGRGTDIVLGGNPEAMTEDKTDRNESTEEYIRELEAARILCEGEKKKVIGLGGLHIIGTERHESRRIDNQLRGRSGRQGDPGSTRFYMALEDDLLRIFGGDRISSVMGKLGMEEGVPIEHKLVTKAIENAQRKVEAHNFDIRKYILEYDDVMNQQREIVYRYRRQILGMEGLKEMITEFIEEVSEDLVLIHIEEKAYPEEWDTNALNNVLFNQTGFKIDAESFKDIDSRDSLVKYIAARSLEVYNRKGEEMGRDLLAYLERMIMIQTLDSIWMDHLLTMDHLKEGIGLRGYAQLNPLQEYKKEGFELFTDMIFRMKSEVVERLLKVRVAEEEDVASLSPVERQGEITLGRGEDVPKKEKPKTVHRSARKIGRNEPCPCGSGKKYKRCCGK